jgi:hypothetical protein
VIVSNSGVVITGRGALNLNSEVTNCARLGRRSAAVAIFRLALVVVALTAACSNGHSSAVSSTSALPASSPATVPHRAFADALQAGNLEAIDPLFASDAQFFTPVLTDPIVGHDRVVRLVGVLLNTFQDIHVTAEIDSTDQFALAFDAHIGSQPIHIYDLLTFDSSGLIITFASHGGPLAGVQALGASVGPHLAQING